MSTRKRPSLVYRILRGVALLGFLALLAAGFGLAWAHVAIRRENPPLPKPGALAELGKAEDAPVRLSWIETASQRTPGDAASADDEGQRLVHPVFVLEWADGRLLLVDTGMDGEYARAFGRPMEWILGADPVEVGRSVAQALGAARDRLVGVVFTHLHVDHTQGIGLLCGPSTAPFSVFMNKAQAERPNYTTRPGLAQVQAASCARPVLLRDSGLAVLEGLSGVGVSRVAGHTPGSQLVFAWVGTGEARRAYVLAGDVVFEKRQIDEDLPKPLLYRLLITPENEAQLGGARRWLRALERQHGFTVVPSHDQAYVESLQLPQFGAPSPRA